MNAEEVLKSPKWPEKWPFYEDDFSRMDETSDGDFYSQPRLVYHIGKYVHAWTRVVRSGFQPFGKEKKKVRIHLAREKNASSLRRTYGVGVVALVLVLPSSYFLLCYRHDCSSFSPFVLISVGLWGLPSSLYPHALPSVSREGGGGGGVVVWCALLYKRTRSYS